MKEKPAALEKVAELVEVMLRAEDEVKQCQQKAEACMAEGMQVEEQIRKPRKRLAELETLSESLEEQIKDATEQAEKAKAQMKQYYPAKPA